MFCYRTKRRNTFQGVNNNSASCQPALDHAVLDYFPIAACLQVFIVLDRAPERTFETKYSHCDHRETWPHKELHNTLSRLNMKQEYPSEIVFSTRSSLFLIPNQEPEPDVPS